MNETTQLSVPERVSAALSVVAIEAEFRALAAESQSIVAITSVAGYDQCHAARMRLVKARTTTVKRGKMVREDAQAFSKAVIAEENRLIGIIQPEETRLQSLQAVEDNKREAKIKEEMARVEEIQSHIKGYMEGAMSMAGRPASQIANWLAALSKTPVGEWAEEFRDEAQAAKDKARLMLEQLLAGAVATEEAAAAEAARQLAEREELASLRAEMTRRDAEAKANAAAESLAWAAARAQIETEAAAARAQMMEQARIALEARQRDDAAAKAVRDAEEARLAAKREEIEAAQRAADAAARKVREELEAQAEAARREKEAIAREAQRQKDELMDGREMLASFRTRYGRRKEFAGVVAAIDTYLKKPEKVAA